MGDRLKEFQRGAEHADPADVDVEMQQESGEKYMGQFFSDVEIVKKHIVAIKQATAAVTDMSQRCAMATTNEKESEINEELKGVLKTTNKKAQLAKQILQSLREDTERLKTSKDAGKAAADIRIREGLANTLTKRFVDNMKEYQNVQQKYKQDIKKKVKRQVQIVKPDASTEEIDAVMKSGGGTSELFRNTILKGDAADSIQNAFMNAKDKYQDVLTLEASVAELHQMFLDFALLTEQQGDLLDQIEFQVKAASDFVEEANIHMASAVELQKSLRFKQLCCFILTLVILGVIALVIWVMTKK